MMTNINICFICGKEFPTKDLTINHIKRKHSDWTNTARYLKFKNTIEIKSTMPENNISDFKNKLISIKGIAIKTADDIISKYNTEEKLRYAVKNNEHLPCRDDIADKLKQLFSKNI